MSYTIELASRAMARNAEPVEGEWYLGINDKGETGAIAKYVNGEFINSAGVVNMSIYTYLRHSGMFTPSITVEGSPGFTLIDDQQAKVRIALRWLETLISSPAVTWDPYQKEACMQALVDAKAAL